MQPHRPQGSSEPFCPYLGILADRETHYQFADESHTCFKVEPPQAIALVHQNRTCLQENHTSCPVYQAGWQGPLPSPLERHPPQRSSPPAVAWILLSSFLALGLIFISGRRAASGSLWFSNTPSESRPVAQATGLAAAVPEEEAGAPAEGGPLPPLEVQLAGVQSGGESDQPLSDLTATPFLIVPQPASPTSPPVEGSEFPTPGPLPGTPFVSGQTFLIHRVLSGETLASIGNRYQTNQETLRAINQTLSGQILQPGRLIVVVWGQTEAAGLPSFEIIYLTRGQTQASIASTHGISVDALRMYNGLGAGQSVPAGRWLIIPGPP